MSRTILFLFLLLIVLGTGWMLFTPIPEYFHIVSDDGRLHLRGEIYNGDALSVHSAMIDEDSVFTGEQYMFSPAQYSLEQPLYLSLDNAGEDVLYRQHERFPVWEALADTQDVEIQRLSDIRIGRSIAVDAPVFLAQYEDMLNLAPEHTVGFFMAASMSINDSAEILIPGSQVQGGCGALVGAGDRQELSRVEQEMHLLINDIDTLVDVQFYAYWVLDAHGCSNQSLEFFN